MVFGAGSARGAQRPLLGDESLSSMRNEKREMVVQHKNQKRRGDLKLAVFSYRKPNP